MNPSEDHDTTELSDSLESLRRKMPSRWDSLQTVTASLVERDAARPGDPALPQSKDRPA
jgi:hypothetical protein